MTETKNHDASGLLPCVRWEEGGVRHEIPVDAEITVGRGPDNRLVVNEQLISRNHCVVSKTPAGFAVTDLQSANGTFVNGERIIGTRLLVAGDHIKVGNFEMTFELESPPPKMAYKAQLTWEEGGQEICREIGDGLTIGRSSEADISTNDLQASRFHCRVEPEGDGYALVDMGSTNGTFLNDERVKDRMALKDGDVVRLGAAKFRFELVGFLLGGAQSIEEAQTIDMPAITPPAAPAPKSTVALPPEPAVQAPPAAPTPTAPPAVAAAAVPAAVELAPAERAAPAYAALAVKPGAATVIDVQSVIKEFDSPGGRVRILKSVSLKVFAGEFVGVRGPSGSGKSTLLNMITGIDRPTSGDVMVAGQSLNKLSENKMARWRGNSIGVIFQFFQLLPTLTVIENIMLPMDFCRKWTPRERQKRAMSLLEQVELAEHAFKLPSMLSGGQQQRAAIARALANDPPLIVADEPTGNLDSKTADRVFMLFSDLVARGKTFLMVTHDTELASRIPRVLEVRDGELFDHNALAGRGD